MIRFLHRFSRKTGGTAAIEFALLAPALLATFFGISEVANYVLAARKIANAAATAADLVSQDTTVTNAEMAEIMSSLDVIVRPFNASNAKIVISQVEADNNGQRTISWSDARHTAPRAPGSPAPSFMPADIVPNNQGVIMAEISYTYKTLFGMFLTNGMEVSDVFYLKPRRSTKVSRES